MTQIFNRRSNRLADQVDAMAGNDHSVRNERDIMAVLDFVDRKNADEKISSFELMGRMMKPYLAKALTTIKTATLEIAQEMKSQKAADFIEDASVGIRSWFTPEEQDRIATRMQAAVLLESYQQRLERGEFELNTHDLSKDRRRVEDLWEDMWNGKHDTAERREMKTLDAIASGRAETPRPAVFKFTQRRRAAADADAR